jgi:hypothetical protein
MKGLIDKIKQYFINRKILKLMNKYLWSENDKKTREEIRVKLNKILDGKLEDITTPEGVDRGEANFQGYSKKRKKVINILIHTKE